MSERKLPSTSISAYKQSNELSVAHKAKILEALREVEYMNYEQIAEATNLDRHAVGRRISELIKEEKIYRTDIKKPTKSGRAAYCLCLSGKGVPKHEEVAKPTKKVKQQKVVTPVEDKVVVSTYLRSKPNAPKQQPNFVQQKLI